MQLTDPSIPTDITASKALWSSKSLAVAARQAWTAPERLFEDDTYPELLAAAHAVADPTMVQQVAPSENCQVRIIDLRNTISLQAIVRTTSVIARTREAYDGSPESLTNICFPGPKPENLAASVDLRGTITVQSVNPNLRVFQPHVDLQSGFLGYRFGFGHPYLSAVEIDGRVVLTNGYHRAAALLSIGVNIVPCVAYRRSAFASFAPIGSLVETTVMGEKPPRLTDYFDDSVSCALTKQPIQKLLLISANESIVTVMPDSFNSAEAPAPTEKTA